MPQYFTRFKSFFSSSQDHELHEQFNELSIRAAKSEGDLAYVQEVLNQSRIDVHNLTIRAEIAESEILNYTDLYLGRKNRIHPFVSESLSELVQKLALSPETISFPKSVELGMLLNENGSDKNTRHSYAAMYEEMLASNQSPKILEIGLGSANPFPYGGSNESGNFTVPGGSLRAFRKRYPKAHLFGADIDPESVANCPETAFEVDQTSYESLSKLRGILSESAFDLIIDDGFHDPHANIKTFFSLFDSLGIDGFYVIEDVHSSLMNFWLVTLKVLDLNGSVIIFSDKEETDDNVVVVIRHKHAGSLASIIRGIHEHQ